MSEVWDVEFGLRVFGVVLQTSEERRLVGGRAQSHGFIDLTSIVNLCLTFRFKSSQQEHRSHYETQQVCGQ